MGKFTGTRTPALLVHGIGSLPAWWNPLLPVLAAAGLKPVPLRLPPLENGGPAGWRDEVLAHIHGPPVLLIGHSLGAAVCLEAARVKPVRGLVLLACPPFFPDFTPPPPPDTGLSAAAMKRVARFLRTACDQASGLQAECIHFVGSMDRWAPVEPARRLPFPLIEIPGAGHGLNRSVRLAEQLAEWLRAFQK